MSFYDIEPDPTDALSISSKIINKIVKKGLNNIFTKHEAFLSE